MKKRQRIYSGTKNPEISQREIRNREIARKAAAEGMVLLKNDGLLPLKPGEKVALFGGGAVRTIKGGTGSGDVNEREVVSIYQGFKEAGISVASKGWLEDFAEIYQKAREDWRALILDEMRETGETNLLNVYSRHSFHMPCGRPIDDKDIDGAKTAFYVISRVAGEGADRFDEPGDYYLTRQEKEELSILSEKCENLAVILNTGGPVDLKEIRRIPNLKALLSIVQPGMEGGHALADLITGKTVPSGKLTDTWAVSYEDYPNSSTFSHKNGDTEKEYYKEGIYVGYRYFDSFERETAYPFGYGLSYTDFSISVKRLEAEGDKITLTTQVTNTGGTFSGKEVVQVYISCPQEGQEKERRRLCGFQKTRLLKPGESQQIHISFGQKELASFEEDLSAWTLEKGKYAVWTGNSSRDLILAGVIRIDEKIILERTEKICPLKEMIEELSCPLEKRKAFTLAWQSQAEKEGVSEVLYTPAPAVKEKKAGRAYQKAASLAGELVEKLTEDELISMVIGEVSKGQGQALGAAGIMVPGAAGETSSALEKNWDVPGVSMADGPAGLRLMRSYEVDKKTGDVYSKGILGALEGGFFADNTSRPDADVYYQYCTAIPVGTLLAQTWNTELMEETGRAVAVEMEEFQVAWWLAPGMNIHRNPLCGRNFEYYSEDPFLSGKMAAAITRGVQSLPGTGTTIKHFACNNQEDNRMGSDSILSERALREIYLRGFEIAVKEAQPMAIMTSYNLINGVHAANCKDLCTTAARKEWGFQGIIMTDWTTTDRGGSIPWKCVEAGNDLIMPGSINDSENIRQALRQGMLTKKDLKDCVKRLLTVIFQTLAYEEAKCYGE